MSLIKIVFSCLLISAALMCTFSSLNNQTIPVPKPESTENIVIDCIFPNLEPRFWISFSSGAGVTVYGFPSKGGIYSLSSCFTVELDFLGLSRFNDTERPAV